MTKYTNEQVTRSLGIQDRIITAISYIEDRHQGSDWRDTVMQLNIQEDRYLTNEEIAIQLVDDKLVLGEFYSNYHQDSLDTDGSRFTNYDEAREQDILNTMDLIIEIRGRFVAPDIIRKRAKSILLRNVEYQSFFNPTLKLYPNILAFSCELYKKTGEDYLTYEEIAGELNTKYGKKDGSNWVSGSSLSIWFSRNRELHGLTYRRPPRIGTTPNTLFDLENGENLFDAFVNKANVLFSTEQEEVPSLTEIVESLNQQFGLEMTKNSFQSWRYHNRELVPTNPDYKKRRTTDVNISNAFEITEEMIMMFDETFGSGEYTIKQAWSMIVNVFNIQDPISGKYFHSVFMEMFKKADNDDPRFKNRREKEAREAQEIKPIEEWLSENINKSIESKVRHLQEQHGLSGHMILRYLGFDPQAPDQDFTPFGPNITTFAGARKAIDNGKVLPKPEIES